MTSLSVVRDTAPASRHVAVGKDIREVITNLRQRHRRADYDHLAGLLVTQMDQDGELQFAIARFAVEKTLAAAEARQHRQAASNGRERIARKAVERQEVQELAAKVKELALLDLIMPNGVAMRFCTGAQMADFGSMYQTIAVKVGPANLVGEVLCEAEAAALLAKSS